MQGVCESFLEKIEILSGGICDLGILRDDVSLSSAAVLPGWKYLFPAGSQERVPDGSPKHEKFNTDILDRYFTVLPDGKKLRQGLSELESLPQTPEVCFLKQVIADRLNAI